MAKMKRVKLLGLLLALSIAAASVAACGPKNTNEESSLPEESSSQSSEVSSQASSESSSEVSSEVSSTVSASVSGGDTSGKPSQGQQVAPVETSDAEFNAHFKSNPIDKAYVCLLYTSPEQGCPRDAPERRCKGGHTGAYHA